MYKRQLKTKSADLSLRLCESLLNDPGGLSRIVGGSGGEETYA